VLAPAAMPSVVLLLVVQAGVLKTQVLIKFVVIIDSFLSSLLPGTSSNVQRCVNNLLFPDES